MPASDQTATEQHHVDRAYRHLDAEIARLGERRRIALASPAGDRTAQTERDAVVHHVSARLTALMHAEPSLCFGRIDRTDGRRLHLGPVGLREDDDFLIIDWRAPAAQPFYAATAREPLGLTRRRHISLAGRQVVRIDDDLLDDSADGEEMVGEGALLRALSGSRDGRMHEAVATLQAEQDAIVRAPKPGVLVVQGAPGTGKTVVALHRAAYLLYHSPEVLRRGVLLIGPNTRFLDYIGDVLPALGETNVVPTTIDDLLPGLEATVAAAPEVARLLGDARMATALSRFLTGLQGASGAAGHTIVWDGDPIHLPDETIQRCADRARKLHREHNIAGQAFRELLLEELTTLVQHADAARLEDAEAGFERELGALDSWIDRNPDSLDPVREDDQGGEEVLDRQALHAELAADGSVRAELETLWPHLTPEEVVTRLLHAGLDHATAGHLSEAEVRLLAENAGPPWSGAHVPLLDEAAELLGEDGEPDAATQRTEREHLAHAERVIAATPGLSGLVSAEELAETTAEADTRDLATRALADRTWTYGHVIVDEAQDLTPMQWRMLARRCPVKSMTIVGDIAQTSAPLATSTWTERLEALGARPRLEELTICYRSPRELVEAVAPLLQELRPDAWRIDAVRSSGTRALLVDGDIDETAQMIRWARDRRGAGQGAVITSDPLRVLGALADGGLDVTDEDLREPLVVLGPTAVKGLEFDHVLVHDPDRIAAGWGPATLYVALTRATGTLTVVQRGAVGSDLGEAWERRVHA